MPKPYTLIHLKFDHASGKRTFRKWNCFIDFRDEKYINLKIVFSYNFTFKKSCDFYKFYVIIIIYCKSSVGCYELCKKICYRASRVSFIIKSIKFDELRPLRLKIEINTHENLLIFRTYVNNVQIWTRMGSGVTKFFLSLKEQTRSRSLDNETSWW